MAHKNPQRPLYDFAFFPDFQDALHQLAELAEDEDWEYRFQETEHPLPVLYNYLHYTFMRLNQEDKIAVSNNREAACFNTGLVTPTQEPIFAFFVPNEVPDKQPWYFRDYRRRGERDLRVFEELPVLAEYFTDPSRLVYDLRKELRANIGHIIGQNRDRFPEEFRSKTDFQLQGVVRGAIENARHRVRRNYKAAVPQWYQGHLQLLLPLCLTDPQSADLALVVEREDGHYRAVTCLTLDMAYNNARLVAKQSRRWLSP